MWFLRLSARDRVEVSFLEASVICVHFAIMNLFCLLAKWHFSWHGIELDMAEGQWGDVCP